MVLLGLDAKEELVQVEPDSTTPRRRMVLTVVLDTQNLTRSLSRWCPSVSGVWEHAHVCQ